MLAARASEMGYGGADRAVYVRVPYLPDRQLLQDFQTRLRHHPRTHDLSLYVVIRSLLDVGVTWCFRIRTDGAEWFGPSRVRVSRDRGSGSADDRVAGPADLPLDPSRQAIYCGYKMSYRTSSRFLSLALGMRYLAKCSGIGKNIECFRAIVIVENLSPPGGIDNISFNCTS
jgi:hypothetical protein